MDVRKLSCLLFILCWHHFAYSQSMRDEMQQPMPGGSAPVTFETFSVWTSDTNAVQVHILYRIDAGFLFFSKKADAAREQYIGQAEVIAELLDTLNNTIARQIQPVQILRSSLPTETDKPNDIQGSLPFTVKPGTYHIHFEAQDAESGKSFSMHEKTIIIQQWKKDSINISSPLLIERLRNDSLSRSHPVLIPVNHGETILFGTTPAYIFQLMTIDSLPNLKVHWNVTGHTNADRDEERHWSDSTYDSVNGVPQGTNEKNEVRYTILDSKLSSKVVYLPLPFEKFSEGHYHCQLTVQAGKKQIQREWHFEVVWKNKPRSLMNLDLAINALRHIATDDEVSQMHGFLSTDSKKFQEFWNKKNPDTTRAYNPVMAEYYRRVDEAIQKYSMAKEVDGYRTDRGRILILFGHPSHIDRSLKPTSVPTEVWTYEKLRKYFIFTDRNRSGNYELTQVETY